MQPLLVRMEREEKISQSLVVLPPSLRIYPCFKSSVTLVIQGPPASIRSPAQPWKREKSALLTVPKSDNDAGVPRFPARRPSTWPYCGSLLATNALLFMLKPGGSGASKAGLAESLGGLSPWSFVIWL